MPIFWAALIAIAAMNTVELVSGALIRGVSPWAPFQRAAAMLIGSSAFSGDTPLAGTIAVGLVVELGWALLLVGILGVLVTRSSLVTAVLFGLAFGVAAYLVEFFAFARTFSWLEGSRGLVALAGHVTFGAVAAAALVTLRRSHRSRAARDPDGASAPERSLDGETTAGA